MKRVLQMLVVLGGLVNNGLHSDDGKEIQRRFVNDSLMYDL